MIPPRLQVSCSTNIHLATPWITPRSGCVDSKSNNRILRWLFTNDDGFSVIQEDCRESSIPDHVIFKVEGRAGGSNYAYDFLLGECKRAGQSWDAAEDQCSRHCENTGQ